MVYRNDIESLTLSNGIQLKEYLDSLPGLRASFYENLQQEIECSNLDEKTAAKKLINTLETVLSGLHSYMQQYNVFFF